MVITKFSLKKINHGHLNVSWEIYSNLQQAKCRITYKSHYDKINSVVKRKIYKYRNVYVSYVLTKNVINKNMSIHAINKDIITRAHNSYCNLHKIGERRLNGKDLILPDYQRKQNINVLIDNRSLSRTRHMVSRFLRDDKAEESGKGRRRRELQEGEPRRVSSRFFCSPYRYVRRTGETSQVSRRRHVIFTHRVCLRWLLFDVLGCPLVLPRLRVWPCASRVPSRVFCLPHRVHTTHTHAYIHRRVSTFGHIYSRTRCNVLLVLIRGHYQFCECPRSNWTSAIE